MKRAKAGTVQSRSVRQCLQALTPSTMPSATSKTSPSTSCMVSLLLSTHSGQLTQSSSQTPATPSRYVTPSCVTISTMYPPQEPLQHQVGNLSNASVTPTASSNGQGLVGSNVFNVAGSFMPPIPCSSRSFTWFSSSPVSTVPRSIMANSESSTKPFVLKMKTNQIRVCQSCREDYNGLNDTMGLLVARAKGRLVSNLLTGTEILGHEGNSFTRGAPACSAFMK